MAVIDPPSMQAGTMHRRAYNLVNSSVHTAGLFAAAPDTGSGGGGEITYPSEGQAYPLGEPRPTE